MAEELEIKRLDDMDFDEVSGIYEGLFEETIEEEKFLEAKNSNRLKYERMMAAIGKGLKFKGGNLGRGDLSYGRTMLYGWFLEELAFFFIEKNPQVKRIEFFGEDKQHDFVVEKDGIRILGKKSTEPDYLILMTNGKKLFLELKSAAKNIYSVKKGNVERLIGSFVDHSMPTAIMMVDLNSAAYEVKGIDFFAGKDPFKNDRMEGQLCYAFPEPKKPMAEFLSEDLIEMAEKSESEFEKNPHFKPYLLLKKAISLGAKEPERTIREKIRIEKLEVERKIVDERIKELKGKNKKSSLSWMDVEKEISSLQQKGKGK